MMENKNFPNPDSTQFSVAMTKALKSFKEELRRRKRKRAAEDDLEGPPQSPPRHRRVQENEAGFEQNQVKITY